MKGAYFKEMVETLCFHPQHNREASLRITYGTIHKWDRTITGPAEALHLCTAVCRSSGPRTHPAACPPTATSAPTPKPLPRAALALTLSTDTAMHGVGTPFTRTAFEAFGHAPLVMVPEQNEPDATFPTVAYPNPEEGKGYPRCGSNAWDPTGPHPEEGKGYPRCGSSAWDPTGPHPEEGKGYPRCGSNVWHAASC
jgi:hypothetical protein